MTSLYSTPDQLQKIKEISRTFLRLPFGYNTVPGDLLEGILAEVRGEGTTRLKKYDFVDVINITSKIGWQVKSTNKGTPVTWKRGKLPGKERLIADSLKSEEARQALGDSIIAYCNDHATVSMDKYGLESIVYCRLINFGDRFLYFEKPLIDRSNPLLFKPEDYEWHWPEPKNTTKKEQLPAFHGYLRNTDSKHFAWHGRGENQLHYTGERLWWPDEGSSHSIVFDAPTSAEKVTSEKLEDWLSKL